MSCTKGFFLLISRMAYPRILVPGSMPMIFVGLIGYSLNGTN